MSRLLRADSLQDADELVRGLGDDDPFIRSAAISSLAKPVFRKRALEEVGNRNARRRLGAMLALRRAKIDRPDSLLEKLLVDPDEQLRRMALVWVGEEKLIPLANRLKLALTSGPVSPALLQTYAATATILTTTNPAPVVAEAVSAQPRGVRTLLLNGEINPDDSRAIEVLADQRSDQLGQLRIAAARTLAQSLNEKGDSVLLKTALDRRNPVQLRAEAVLALSNRPTGATDWRSGLRNAYTVLRPFSSEAVVTDPRGLLSMR